MLEKLCRGESGRILRSVSPPAGETVVELRALPRRPRRADPRVAEGVRAAARAGGGGAAPAALRRRLVRIGAVLLALVAGFAGLAAWALKKSSDATRATASARSRRARVGLERPACNAPRHVAAPQPRGQPLPRHRAGERQHALGARFAPAHGRRGDPSQRPEKPSSGSRSARTGKTLAAAGSDGKVVLWDAVHDYRKLTSARHRPRHPSTGSRSARTGTRSPPPASGKVVLWDAAHDYRRLAALASGQSGVDGVAFSPDGKTLAAAGDAGTSGALGCRPRLPQAPSPRQRPRRRRQRGRVQPGRQDARRRRPRRRGGALGCRSRLPQAPQPSAAASQPLQRGRVQPGREHARRRRRPGQGGALGRRPQLPQAASPRRRPTTPSTGSRSARTGARSPPPARRQRWCSGTSAHDYRKLAAARQRPRHGRHRGRVQPGRQDARRRRRRRRRWCSGTPLTTTAGSPALASGQELVNGVAFSPDGNTLAAAGADGKVVLWDAAHDYGRLTGPRQRPSGVTGWRSARTGTRSPPPATTARWCSGTPPTTTRKLADPRQRPRRRPRGRVQPGRQARSPPPATNGKVVLWDAAHDYRKLTGPRHRPIRRQRGRVQPGRKDARRRRRRRRGGALGRRS